MKHKKNILFIVLGVGVTLLVFGAFLWANLGFLNIIGYFENGDAHSDDILLFFHGDCPYCVKVDAYITSNKVDSKVTFIRLNVENSYNENILSDKAQICGMDEHNIGVPFLWDGPDKKCVIGYIDIINFFRQKMIKK